ncbi:hypothetical protein [Oleiharenicola sp. Vm1]|uniref:hypothetical protein n=1 Tax=Oleiharenicola sp. Vm1 TaxID=3398393 RepID=UPI0039F4DD40
MRLFLSLLGSVLLLAGGVRADPPAAGDDGDPLAAAPAPLREAVAQFGRDANRWAYTVHTVSRDKKGRVTEDTVARFDPSQHYDVQWTLLQTGGKDATAVEQKKFRKQRAKMNKDRKTFGELLDLAQARLIPDAPGAPATLSYLVPLRQEANSRFPVDKVEAIVRIDAGRQAFQAIELRLKQAVRALLIAKVKSASATIDFRAADPRFAPVVCRIRADLGAAIAFVPVEQHTEQTRSDFKRVTPYDDRFVVKPGPLRTIDF